MATTADLLTDAFTRIRDGALGAVEGLDGDALTHRPGGTGNPVGWLVWHLLRVQDDHVADVAGRPQVWSDGWSARFDLPYAADATGFGQSGEEVAAFRASASHLSGYARAVTDATVAYLGGLSDDDLDRVVDEGWDPPVTLGARLVSVVEDDLQHLGQARYVRGLVPGS